MAANTVYSLSALFVERRTVYLFVRKRVVLLLPAWEGTMDSSRCGLLPQLSILFAAPCAPVSMTGLQAAHPSCATERRALSSSQQNPACGAVLGAAHGHITCRKRQQEVCAAEERTATEWVTAVFHFLSPFRGPFVSCAPDRTTGSVLTRRAPDQTWSTPVPTRDNWEERPAFCPAIWDVSRCPRLDIPICALHTFALTCVNTANTLR